MAQNLYNQLQTLTPENVPIDRHPRSNEQNKPYETINEARVLFSSKLVHSISPKTKRAEIADFLRTQSDGITVPCFLQSEEFLERIGELPDNFQPGYEI